MNKVVLIGRLVRDVEIRYSKGENSIAIGRYTLAVDRKFKRDGEQTADFISCLCFGRSAEFAEKYFHQGMKITVVGRIQTGSYIDKEGIKRYTTEVVIEEQEFAESKKSSDGSGSGQATGHQADRPKPGDDGFMNIPDGIDDSELPFN